MPLSCGILTAHGDGVVHQVIYNVVRKLADESHRTAWHIRVLECRVLAGRQCKKACENNHVYVRELPDTQALPLCRIKERV